MKYPIRNGIIIHIKATKEYQIERYTAEKIYGLFGSISRCRSTYVTQKEKIISKKIAANNRVKNGYLIGGNETLLLFNNENPTIAPQLAIKICGIPNNIVSVLSFKYGSRYPILNHMIVKIMKAMPKLHRKIDVQSYFSAELLFETDVIKIKDQCDKVCGWLCR